MRIGRLTVSGYRSIREINLKMESMNLIIGPNGSGKTNLYRSLYLLHAAASGRFSRVIAEEGGMPSLLWAGRRRKGPVRVKIHIELDDLAYELAFGPPPPNGASAFNLDPQIKHEKIWLLHAGRRIPVLERNGSYIQARNLDGERFEFGGVHDVSNTTGGSPVSSSESVLAEIRDPTRFPELAKLREIFIGWRFYHQFRTDPDSPLRRPQIGIQTPILAHNADDLLSALVTIQEQGDAEMLHRAIGHAFPGSTLRLESHTQPFSLYFGVPGLTRWISQQEISDGTLHFFCLLAALLPVRKPSLIAINEPEASLHPDLLPALAELLANASRHSQLWITTHSETLSQCVKQRTAVEPFRLYKHEGETRLEGHSVVGKSEEDSDD